LPNLKAHRKYKLSAREHEAHFVAADFAMFVSKSGMFVVAKYFCMFNPSLQCLEFS